MKKCKAKNCFKKSRANGYCARHNAQMYEYGRIMQRTKYDKNEYIDRGNYYEICLYNIKNKEIARALIDKKYYNKTIKYKWRLTTKGYAQNRTNALFLHRLIIGIPPQGYEVDHINRNKLDNRRNNLRFLTRSENSRNNNSKGYHYNKKLGKWRATIQIGNKCIHLGLFINEKDANTARRKAEIKYWGRTFK